MNNKNLTKKQSYDLARHHAWAGGILLSILLALRLLIPQLPQTPITLLALLLIAYITISVLFTYKYKNALTQKEPSTQKNAEDNDYELEKQRLKIQKKQAKNENKQHKKQNK